MRLVCPNCEAKYEVPDDAIPDTGRDVQCTNCGHSWFHMRGRTAVAPVAVQAPVETVPEPVAAPAPAPAPAPEDSADPVMEVEAAAADVAAEAVTAPDPLEAAAVLADMPAAVEDVPPEALAAAEAVGDGAPEAVSVVEAAGEAFAEADVGPGAGDDLAKPAETAAEAAIENDVALSEVAAEVAPEAPPPIDLDALISKVAQQSDGADPDPVVQLDPAVGAGPEDDLPAASAQAYAVDDSVLAILREEAEREANARRAEALESQTDLGLDAAIPATVASAAPVEARPSARRDLLPDVEEINSTLRPSEKQAEADGAPDFVAPAPEAPRGFRSGFLSLMTIAILGAALYVVAPRLGVMVPALSGPLEAYVSMIDSLRLGLDGMMRSATVAISDG